MRSKSIILLFAISLLIPLAGCVPSNGEVVIGYNGDFNTSTEEFMMDGELTVGGAVPDVNKYQNVSVILYTNSGEEIISRELGGLATDGERLPVTLKAEVIPKYVIFRSPDFWEGKMQVEYYVYRDGSYAIEYATSRSDLPIS